MRERGDRGAGRRGDAATRGDPVGTGRRVRGRAARRATRRATFATFEDDAFGSTFGSSAPSAARDRGRASEIWRGARGRDLGEGTVRRATHLAEDLRDEARLALGRDGFLEQRDVREELSRGTRGGGGRGKGARGRRRSGTGAEDSTTRAVDVGTSRIWNAGGRHAPRRGRRGASPPLPSSPRSSYRPCLSSPRRHPSRRAGTGEAEARRGVARCDRTRRKETNKPPSPPSASKF